MARVFKRDTSWGIDYVADGIRRREIVSKNKVMAQKALRKKLVLIDENRFLDVKRQPKVRLSELIEKYIELYLKPNRPTWWKSEKHNLRHLVNYFGNRYLHEINPINIDEFRLDRLTQVSQASVNKNVACLRAMFNKAIEWNLFPGRNPAAGIKFYKLENKRLRFLEKEEIARLLSVCRGHLKDILEFAINTGMRKGEIFNLKWHDIDMTNGIIHVLKTKSGQRREIPMNETIKNIFFRVRKDPGSPYVFASHTGKAFIDVKHSFYTALKEANIENFRFHDLRHTFASHLVMSGVDLLTVKELLGHKKIEMTLRYSHLSCAHKKRAVMALDQLSGTNKAHDLTSEALSQEFSDRYESMESPS